MLGLRPRDAALGDHVRAGGWRRRRLRQPDLDDDRRAGVRRSSVARHRGGGRPGAGRVRGQLRPAHRRRPAARGGASSTGVRARASMLQEPAEWGPELDAPEVLAAVGPRRRRRGRRAAAAGGLHRRAPGDRAAARRRRPGAGDAEPGGACRAAREDRGGGGLRGRLRRLRRGARAGARVLHRPGWRCRGGPGDRVGRRPADGLPLRARGARANRRSTRARRWDARAGWRRRWRGTGCASAARP